MMDQAHFAERLSLVRRLFAMARRKEIRLNQAGFYYLWNEARMCRRAVRYFQARA